MKTKVVVTLTETVTDIDTFGSQLLSKTFDIFIYKQTATGHPVCHPLKQTLIGYQAKTIQQPTRIGRFSHKVFIPWILNVLGEK